MINFMTANIQPKGRYSFDNICTMLKAQIHNSLDVGWDKQDIIVISNFPFEFMGVKAIERHLNSHCLTGSKMFGVKILLDEKFPGGTIWAHDLDAWQNAWFDCPNIKDVAISTYSQDSNYNGGSVFWSDKAKDLVDEICISLKKEAREEPTINKVLKKNKQRVTLLNCTYNVGCSGFVARMQKAVKPVLVSHFNPMNRIAWETHRLDRDKAGEVSVSPRLENILRQYYQLASKGK